MEKIISKMNPWRKAVTRLLRHNYRPPEGCSVLPVDPAIALRDLPSPLAQPFECFQDSHDLFGAFFVPAAEAAGKGLGIIRSHDTHVVRADELADERNLSGKPIRPLRLGGPARSAVAF